MTDEKLSPKEYLREHDADGNATIRHTHDPASGLDAEDPHKPSFDELEKEWNKASAERDAERKRAVRAEWEHAEARALVKKLEAELARMRARLGDMTEELGEQVGRQEALEVLGQGSKP